MSPTVVCLGDVDIDIDVAAGANTNSTGYTSDTSGAAAGKNSAAATNRNNGSVSDVDHRENGRAGSCSSPFPGHVGVEEVRERRKDEVAPSVIGQAQPTVVTLGDLNGDDEVGATEDGRNGVEDEGKDGVRNGVGDVDMEGIEVKDARYTAKVEEVDVVEDGVIVVSDDDDGHEEDVTEKDKEVAVLEGKGAIFLKKADGTPSVDGSCGLNLENDDGVSVVVVNGLFAPENEVISSGTDTAHGPFACEEDRTVPAPNPDFLLSPAQDGASSVVILDDPFSDQRSGAVSSEVGDARSSEEEEATSEAIALPKRFSHVEIYSQEETGPSPARVKTARRASGNVEDETASSESSRKRVKHSHTLTEDVILFDSSAEDSDYEPSSITSPDESQDEEDWSETGDGDLDDFVVLSSGPRDLSIDNEELIVGLDGLPDDILYQAPYEATATPETSEEDGFLDDHAVVESNARRYWFFKTQPHCRILDGVDVSLNLQQIKEARWPQRWDGVRNHQAKHTMLHMRKGDLAFVYHCKCACLGIAGIVRLTTDPFYDETALDPSHAYHDRRAHVEDPRWMAVKVEFVHEFGTLFTLRRMKALAANDGPLEHMQALRHEQVSVSAVSGLEWEAILEDCGEDEIVMERVRLIEAGVDLES